MGRYSSFRPMTTIPSGANLSLCEEALARFSKDPEMHAHEERIRGISVDTVSSCFSIASSAAQYADPSQTLLFLDWDDTLFPTTRVQELVATLSPEELDATLQPWREAVRQFLVDACTLSERCAIVTNATSPWVETCIDLYAPALRPLLESEGGCLRVVYASEEQDSTKTATKTQAKPPSSSKSCFLSGCAGGALHGIWDATVGVCGVLVGSICGSDATEDDNEYLMMSRSQSEAITKQLTADKRKAMERVAREFYGRYPGQTWKNVLSFGDMRYEFDAVRGLTDDRSRFRKLLSKSRGRVASLLPPCGGRSGSRSAEEPTATSPWQSPSAQGFLFSPGNERRMWKWFRREQLRTKAFVVPGAPRVSSLVLQLQFLRVLLPVLVHLNADVSLDVSASTEPDKALAGALGIPGIGAIGFPLHAWGLGCQPSADEAERALDELAILVQRTLLVNGFRRDRTDSCSSTTAPSSAS